ncbi:MAG: twin transmembrane helix small protein [Bauldia sp.]|nr:twin transmembrane helix small protein [Bauldia sp.]
MGFWQILGLVAAGLVVIVLIFGLVNLMRGGPPNVSQKLMRARILLQLIAVIIVMFALYMSTRGSG